MAIDANIAADEWNVETGERQIGRVYDHSWQSMVDAYQPYFQCLFNIATIMNATDATATLIR